MDKKDRIERHQDAAKQLQREINRHHDEAEWLQGEFNRHQDKIKQLQREIAQEARLTGQSKCPHCEADCSRFVWDVVNEPRCGVCGRESNEVWEYAIANEL
jgi:aspartate oxidase